MENRSQTRLHAQNHPIGISEGKDTSTEKIEALNEYLTTC